MDNPYDTQHSTQTGTPQDQQNTTAGSWESGSKNAMDEALRKAESAKETLRAKAGEVTHKTEEAVNRGRDRAASALDRAAAKIRGVGTRIPGGQRTTGIADRTAGKLSHTAGYLREHDARAMASDVKESVRRHPTEALIGALIAGFLVGRSVRGRS